MLSSRSKVFQEILSLLDSSHGILPIDESDSDIIEILLDYIYTDNLVEDSEINLIIQLCKIGDKYDVNGLVDLCESKLCKIVDQSNIVILAEMTETLGLENLNNSIIKFLRLNMNSVATSNIWPTLRKRYCNLMLDAFCFKL